MAVFDPARCAQFDQVSGTTVWRGNIPINSAGKFAYHEMAAALEFESDVAFIDVSLIDNVPNSERVQWLVELDAYGVPESEFPGASDIPPQFNQPGWCAATLRGDGVHLGTGTAPGHLLWWQIEGGHDSIVLGPETRSYNFIGLLEYLGILRGHPKSLLYVHCMNGTDRTGAVVAGYAMRYLGASLEEAFELANSVGPAGIMNPDYRALVTAYHQWLSSHPT